MDDARKQEIMARANAVLERLDDEAMAASWADIAKRERIERVQKCLDYTPEQPHDDGGLPPDEQDAVKQWVWKQSGQATPAPVNSSTTAVSAEWVQAHLDVIVDVIAEETASDNEKICAAIRSLKEKVATLRGEVDVLRGIARGEIASIASKGKTSDAA